MDDIVINKMNQRQETTGSSTFLIRKLKAVAGALAGWDCGELGLSKNVNGCFSNQVKANSQFFISIRLCTKFLN